MLCSVLRKDGSSLLQWKQAVPKVKALFTKIQRPPCTVLSSLSQAQVCQGNIFSWNLRVLYEKKKTPKTHNLMLHMYLEFLPLFYFTILFFLTLCHKFLLKTNEGLEKDQ